MDASCFVFSWIIKDLKLGPRQEKRDRRSQTEGRTEASSENGRRGVSPKLEETGMSGIMKSRSERQAAMIWGSLNSCMEPDLVLTARGT